MVGIIEISGALNSINLTKNILETMIGLRDAAAFQQKRMELMGKVVEVQMSMSAALNEQTALTETISELKKRIADLEAWEAEKQNYELKALDRVSFVYASKQSMEGGEPPHWLCANCYTQGKKAILQIASEQVGGLGDRGWQCPRCQAKIVTRGATYPTKCSGDNDASP